MNVGPRRQFHVVYGRLARMFLSNLPEYLVEDLGEEFEEQFAAGFEADPNWTTIDDLIRATFAQIDSHCRRMLGSSQNDCVTGCFACFSTRVEQSHSPIRRQQNDICGSHVSR